MSECIAMCKLKMYKYSCVEVLLNGQKKTILHIFSILKAWHNLILSCESFMLGSSCNFLTCQPPCCYLKMYTKVFVSYKISCTLDASTFSVWRFNISNIEYFYLICIAKLHNLL